MLNTIIISGGSINEKFFKEVMKKGEFNNVIACDKGLEVLYKCNIKPNYIIGDFDSINKNILKNYKKDNNVKIMSLNPEKDYTDTHMALKLAIDLNSNEITIVGAIGTRLDHTLANINILKEALDNEITCKIINENNYISLINKTTIIEKDNRYKYVSLIPITTTATGITLQGFKYSLHNATMKIGESIGVSNEQIEQLAKISIKEGTLILLKTNDY